MELEALRTGQVYQQRGTEQRHPTTRYSSGVGGGPVEQSPPVGGVHLQAQLEGPAGNRGA